MKGFAAMLTAAAITAVASFATSNASAQDPGDASPPAPTTTAEEGNPNGQPPSELAKLRSQVEGLRKRVVQLESASMDARNDIDSKLAELRQRQTDADAARTAMTERIDQMSKQHEQDTLDLAVAIQSNLQSLKDLRDVAEDNRGSIAAMKGDVDNNAQIVKRISRNDGSDGSVPNVLGNMENSRSFRREMVNATTGKLRFINDGGVDRIVYVNGTPWRAIPGRSYVWVPMGRVAVTRTASSASIANSDWDRSADGRYFELTYDFSNPW